MSISELEKESERLFKLVSNHSHNCECDGCWEFNEAVKELGRRNQ